jgi:hypothetical protein
MKKAEKLRVYSVSRSRAHAREQRALGLKVGGTATVFRVSDGERAWTIEAWGATPGERRSAALRAFEQGGNWLGESSKAIVRERSRE